MLLGPFKKVTQCALATRSMLLIKFMKTVSQMLDLHAQQPATSVCASRRRMGFSAHGVWHRGQGRVWCERIEMVLCVGREDVSKELHSLIVILIQWNLAHDSEARER